MSGERARRRQGPTSPWGLLGLGFEIAVPIVLFMYVGHKLDGWLGTDPWLLVSGALLGIVVGFYGFLKRVLPGRADDRPGK